MITRPNRIPFTPNAWWWLADDGRTFSSAEKRIADTGDADYKAWLADRNHAATRWPPDETGKQTNASLQEVVSAYGVTVPE